MTLKLKLVKGATPLDPNELGGLKPKHITTQGQLDELEQANITSGLRWLARGKHDVFSDDFVCTLHKRLFGDVWDWAGTYRKSGKNIGIDKKDIAVEVRMLLDNAKSWVEYKSWPTLEAGARFHHRMVQIHPFANGNGRHARIITDLMLKNAYGAPPIDWAAGSDLKNLTQRRKDYLAALVAADHGEYELLRAFVGAPVASAAKTT